MLPIAAEEEFVICLPLIPANAGGAVCKPRVPRTGNILNQPVLRRFSALTLCGMAVLAVR
jgi:hypothetical protein